MSLINPLIEKSKRLIDVIKKLQKNSELFSQHLETICSRLILALDTLIESLLILHSQNTDITPTLESIINKLHDILNKTIEFLLFFDSTEIKGVSIAATMPKKLDVEYTEDRLARYQKMIHLMQHKLRLHILFIDKPPSSSDKMIQDVKRVTSNDIPSSLFPNLSLFTPILEFGLANLPSPTPSPSHSSVARQREYLDIQKSMDQFRKTDFATFLENERISAAEKFEEPKLFNHDPSKPPKDFTIKLPIIMLLSGPPGVGKTTYAKYLAVKLAEDYFYSDYSVYFDLNRFGVYYMHSDGTQNAIKSCISPEVSGLGSNTWRLEKVKERYRALYKNKRGIILLDNAHNQEDIRSLLPISPTFPLNANEGYIAIVCVDSVDAKLLKELPVTKDFDSQKYAHCLHQEVPPFDIKGSRLMMAKIVQTYRDIKIDFSKKEQLDNLTSICLGMPLLIRIALYFGAHDPKKFMQRVLKLGDSFSDSWFKELDIMSIEIRQVLTQCFLQLPFTSQLVILLLRVFPSHFDVHAANAVIGEALPDDSPPLSDILEHLVVCGFISRYYSPSQGLDGTSRTAIPVLNNYFGESVTEDLQYFFHPIIRKLSRLLVKQFPSAHLVSGSAFTQIQRKFVFYYAHVLDLVEELYETRGPSPALKLFDAHVQHIQASIFFTFQLENNPKDDKKRQSSPLDSTNQTLTMSLLQPRTFFRYRLSSRQRRRMYHHYYECISTQPFFQNGNQHKHAHVLTALGDLHSEIGEVEHALKYYHRALDCCAGNVANIIDSKNFEQKFQIQKFPPASLAHVASTLLQIGRTLTSVENLEDALRYYDRALNVFAWIDNYKGRGRVYNDMGSVYKMMGNYQSALKYHQEAVKVYQRALEESRWSYKLPKNADSQSSGLIPPSNHKGIPNFIIRSSLDGLACSLNNIAIVYEITNQYKGAIVVYEEARKISLVSNNIDTLTLSLIGLGSCYDRFGTLLKSVIYLHTAKFIQQYFGNLITVGDIFHNLGIVYEKLGENNRSLESYQSCRTIRLELRDIYRLPFVLNNLGSIYETTLDFHEAFQCYRESIAINKANHSKPGVAYGMNGLGNVFMMLEQYTKALQCFTKCRSLRKELQDSFGLISVCHSMAQCYEKLHSYDKALSLYDEAKDLCISLKNYSGLASVIANMGQLYNSLGDINASMQLLPISIKIYKRMGLYCAAFFNSSSLIRQLKKVLNEEKNTEEYFLILLKNHEKNNDKFAIAMINKELGDFYYKINNINHSIQCFEKSRQLFEHLIKHGQNRVSCNKYLRSVFHALGDLYKTTGDVNKAMSMYEQSKIGANNVKDYQKKPIDIDFDSITSNSNNFVTF